MEADMPSPAWIILPGHPDVPARLRVVAYSIVARAWRTGMAVVMWIASTLAMFFVTMFDPFLTGIPLLVGGVMTLRAWRGRYRVTEFDGRCPRCAEPITLEPGSRIASPHRLVCYHCHHEPQLFLAA